MEAVIIVIHLMVILALIAVVLLQRSEGGALGIGGSNQFLSTRGQGNVLTRATTILGIVFFLTSVGLTILSRLQPPPSAILNNVQSTVAPVIPPTTTPGSTAGSLVAPTPLVPTPGGATLPGTTPPTPAPTPTPATPAPAAPAQ
jgi:preprotein translocase subunit SecG